MNDYRDFLTSIELDTAHLIALDSATLILMAPLKNCG